MRDKLIIITHQDLSPGYQAVQSGHAAIQFQYDFPILAKRWYSQSNYLIFLSAKNEAELTKILHKGKQLGIQISIFREPDIGNQITAIALAPSKAANRLVSNLPLTLKKRREMV